MMAYASLQAMSPELAAIMEPPEVQDDPSSSSSSQPQENAPQSPVAVQAGTSTATGHAARCMTLVLAFALSPAFFNISGCVVTALALWQLWHSFYHPLVVLQSMHVCAVWPHAHMANALGC